MGEVAAAVMAAAEVAAVIWVVEAAGVAAEAASIWAAAAAM